jgi:hypothetical protein
LGESSTEPPGPPPEDPRHATHNRDGAPDPAIDDAAHRDYRARFPDTLIRRRRSSFWLTHCNEAATDVQPGALPRDPPITKPLPAVPRKEDAAP